MTLFLRYLEEFDNYGIEKQAISRHNMPTIKLAEDDQRKFCGEKKPIATIGLLMGQDTSADGTEYYTVEKSYLRTISKAGAELRFLDYDHHASQLRTCDGLILPGGVFNSPATFYLHPSSGKSSKRSDAYACCILTAESAGKPILGICAGAQMTGGMHCMKMYRSTKEETSSKTQHKMKEKQAHHILLFANSPLQKIMKTKELDIIVNSRHNESLIETPLQQYFPQTDMQVYAVSKKDNLPEAWGNEKKNILCIQWHPENLADDNPSMQNIFNWVVKKSAQLKIQNKRKLKLPLSLFDQFKTRR